MLADRSGDLAGDRLDKGKIRFAGLRLRGAYANEQRLRRIDRVPDRRGKVQASVAMALQQLGKVTLMDRRFSPLQGVDFRCVVVHGDYVVSDFREASR